ncbi:MAG: hypothetical protein EXS37_12595 [Opitutus sp.]|nr:hypothetical protein [Opitutus sp.]
MHFRPKSLKEVAEQALNLEAWGLALAEFMDEVNATRKQGRGQALFDLIREEPPIVRFRFEGGDAADAFGAALAEYLAQSVSIPPPPWTRKAERFLADAWFPLPHISEHPRLRELIERLTPQPFREHNVFIDENSLART